MESRQDVERFVDRMKMGRLSRREFKAGLASVGLGMTVAPLSGHPALAQGDEHPTCFTWATYDVPDMHQEYVDKHGASPNFTLWGDEEEAEAKMVAGFRPDVAMPCSYKVQKWNDFGFLQPIDTSRLSHWGRCHSRPQERSGHDDRRPAAHGLRLVGSHIRHLQDRSRA